MTGNKYNSYGVKYFHAHRIAPGDSLFFAGERVPILNSKIKEKIERELYPLTYYRSSTRGLLKKMDYWLPKFEPILKQHGIPNDLKYLVVIESNLANVVSNRAAAGFWQFRAPTAIENGLVVNNQLDQRYDQHYATIAACRYLRKMHRRLGSWVNVAASYNMGINGFLRQQRVQRKQSYFDLKLNKETGRYLYKMIALKMIDDNRKAYKFRHYSHAHPSPYKVIIIRDSMEVNTQQLAEERGVSLDLFKVINPWVLDSVIAPVGEKYRLLLPKEIVVNKTDTTNTKEMIHQVEKIDSTSKSDTLTLPETPIEKDTIERVKAVKEITDTLSTK